MIESDIQMLRSKVSREQGLSDSYTRDRKQRVKDYWPKTLVERADRKDKVKVRKVLNNLILRRSVFIPDDLAVNSVSANWQLWSEIADNFNKVAESDFETMNLREKYADAMDDDALLWVGCIAVDGWNNHSQTPIVNYVDSRLTYPDPQNHQGSRMRWFGTKLRKNIFELLNDSAYDYNAVKKAVFFQDSDISERQRIDSWENQESEKWDDMIDIYNHLTVFAESGQDPAVYLTTWGNWIDIPLRILKMRPLTEWEKEDPTTVDLGVILFRAKPLKWSYAGVSLVDDVKQFEDIETLLTNLMIFQSQESAMWGRVFLDTRLWVDSHNLEVRKPSQVIPYTPIKGAPITAQQGIYQEPPKQVSQNANAMIQKLDALSQEATNVSSIAQWQSLSGSQTKSEVQILQQNINNVLWYMGSNYRESMKSLWKSIYRSYQVNMSPQRTKEVVIIDTGESFWFKKNEFISKWESYIKIVSKKEKEAEAQKDFTRLLSVYGNIISQLDPNSVASKVVNRMLIDKSWISDIKWVDIFGMTSDEIQAYDNLQILNLNRPLKTKPQPWEDHQSYIDIYKNGIPTEARDQAIEDRRRALAQKPATPTQSQDMAGQSRAISASLLANEQSKDPSLQDVNI